jgi:hypothetical protein
MEAGVDHRKLFPRDWQDGIGKGGKSGTDVQDLLIKGESVQREPEGLKA